MDTVRKQKNTKQYTKEQPGQKIVGVRSRKQFLSRLL